MSLTFLQAFAQNSSEKIDTNINNSQANNIEIDFLEMSPWTKLKVAYKVYVGGIKVAVLNLSLNKNNIDAFSSDIYLNVTANTSKFVDFFSAGKFKMELNADWFGELRSVGVIAKNYLIDANFSSNGVVSSRVIYDNLNTIDSWFYYNSAAPDRSNYKNYEFVTYEHIKNSVDPLFAVIEFQLLSSLTNKPCDYKKNIFTGDHIDTISGELISKIKIKRSNYNSYQGDGFSCTWSAKPVAGFFLPNGDANTTKKKVENSKIELDKARKYISNKSVILDFAKHNERLPTFLTKGVIKTKYATFHLVASSYSIWLNDQILVEGLTN